MKKNNLLTILFLILSALTMSCSSNSNGDTNNPTSNSIIGKWIWTTKIENGISTPDNPSQNGCPRNYIEFKDNNTCTEVHYGDACKQNIYPGGNYVRDGKFIKYPPSTAHDEEILELTSEKMKLLDHYGIITVYEKKH